MVSIYWSELLFKQYEEQITINENKYTQASSGLADTFSHDNDQNVCSLDQKHSRCFTFLNMNSHFVIFQIVIYQIS